ncbi:MAG: winged helix-turn-helix transcriptional regulator [Solirubrobacterales bacterium]
MAGLLKLVGTGVAGEILTALAPRSLRTRSLTDRLSKCAPRTVYRHAGRLADQGLVVREEESGVPSTVVYKLSDRGRRLLRLLEAHAGDALSRRPEGSDGWTSLALLGEMWASGWIAALSNAFLSPTELSEMTPGMSFHQVNRRVHLLRSRGLLSESTHGGRGRHYKLTTEVRRRMGLIAGVGRWREQHGLAERRHGLTGPETATVLRVALPLVKLNGGSNRQLKLGIVGARDGSGGRRAEVLLVGIGRDGYLRCAGDSDRPADAWAAGATDLWLSALVDGNRGRLRTGGDVEFLDACLAQLRTALWSGEESAAA